MAHPLRTPVQSAKRAINLRTKVRFGIIYLDKHGRLFRPAFVRECSRDDLHGLYPQGEDIRNLAQRQPDELVSTCMSYSGISNWMKVLKSVYCQRSGKTQLSWPSFFP